MPVQVLDDFPQGTAKAACYCCGGGVDRPQGKVRVVDFQQEVEYEGYLMICEACVTEAARLLGMLTTDELDEHLSNVADLRERVAEAEGRVAFADEVLDNVRGYDERRQAEQRAKDEAAQTDAGRLQPGEVRPPGGAASEGDADVNGDVSFNADELAEATDAANTGEDTPRGPVEPTGAADLNDGDAVDNTAGSDAATPVAIDPDNPEGEPGERTPQPGELTDGTPEAPGGGVPEPDPGETDEGKATDDKGATVPVDTHPGASDDVLASEPGTPDPSAKEPTTPDIDDAPNPQPDAGVGNKRRTKPKKS